MNKYLLSFSLGAVLFLSACGDGTDEPVASEEDEEVSAVEDEAEENQLDDAEPEASEVSDSYLDTGDFIFEFNEVEQMESGRNPEDQIIAIELTFTNNSDDAISPWMASAQAISAIQETDVTEETLQGANGQYPDGYKTELVDMGDTNVKAGATVEAVIGYQLLYPGEEVILEERTFGDSEPTFIKIIETE